MYFVIVLKVGQIGSHSAVLKYNKVILLLHWKEDAQFFFQIEQLFLNNYTGVWEYMCSLLLI